MEGDSGKQVPGPGETAGKGLLQTPREPGHLWQEVGRGQGVMSCSCQAHTSANKREIRKN